MLLSAYNWCHKEVALQNNLFRNLRAIIRRHFQIILEFFHNFIKNKNNHKPLIFIHRCLPEHTFILDRAIHCDDEDILCCDHYYFCNRDLKFSDGPSKKSPFKTYFGVKQKLGRNKWKNVLSKRKSFVIVQHTRKIGLKIIVLFYSRKFIGTIL